MRSPYILDDYFFRLRPQKISCRLKPKTSFSPRSEIDNFLCQSVGKHAAPLFWSPVIIQLRKWQFSLPNCRQTRWPLFWSTCFFLYSSKYVRKTEKTYREEKRNRKAEKKRQKRAKKSEKDAKKRKQTIIGFYLFIDRCLVGRPKPTIAKLWSSEHEAKANNIRKWRRQHSIRNNRKKQSYNGQILFFLDPKINFGKKYI